MLEDLLLKSVQDYGEKTAVVYGSQRLSYQDIYQRIKNFSTVLVSYPLEKGDCVAVLLSSCPEFIISFYAIARLNGIVLPLNHLFKQDEISYYIRESGAKAIITDPARARLCAEFLKDFERPVTLIVVGEPPADLEYPWIIRFDDSPETADSTDKAVPVLGEAEVLYQYSSGSTGRPKRIARTQANLVSEALNLRATAQISSSDRILCLVPLYHAHGLGNCLLAALSNGATLVILEQKRLKDGTPVEAPFLFKRQRVLELIEAEKITVFPSVPYILEALADVPESVECDLSTMRLCFSAGNFLSRDLYDKFLKRFGVPIRQLYGCTEAGSVAINLDPDDALDKTWNSVGCPMSNVHIDILDDHGHPLPTGEIGEILIKSEALTSGYCNMPELNGQAFQRGGFLTGDLGKLDEAGRLYITGRKKILIDTGGRKVDPIEVEDVLLKHASVGEVVVVGVKGNHAGEMVKAVIVPKHPHPEPSLKGEIISHCQQSLAEFKVPKIIEFRDEIPKSPLGKVLRKALV